MGLILGCTASVAGENQPSVTQQFSLVAGEASAFAGNLTSQEYTHGYTNNSTQINGTWRSLGSLINAPSSPVTGAFVSGIYGDQRPIYQFEALIVATSYGTAVAPPDDALVELKVSGLFKFGDEFQPGRGVSTQAEVVYTPTGLGSEANDGNGARVRYWSTGLVINNLAADWTPDPETTYHRYVSGNTYQCEITWAGGV